MTSAIELIGQIAPDFLGTCKQTSATSAILDLPVKLVDGRSIPYKLQLTQAGKLVKVREETPQQLPAFCPERHINPNGTFCLYYAGVARLDVVNAVSAREWLETVYKYLLLQERARIQRRWPNNDVWAHGDAARHQHRAQIAAAAINDKIASALADNRLQLKYRSSKGRPILELRIEGTHLYSVWESDERVINQKQRCFCGNSGLKVPKRLRKCTGHAKQATELALALRDWRKAEDQFWKEVQDKNCCGTCDSCRLQRPQ